MPIESVYETKNVNENDNVDACVAYYIPLRFSAEEYFFSGYNLPQGPDSLNVG